MTEAESDFFENIGIKSEIAEKIILVTEQLLSKHPNSPVGIQRVSELSGFGSEIVKKVFFSLLILRRLKTTLYEEEMFFWKPGADVDLCELEPLRV